MSIKVDFFGLNDFLARPIPPNNDEETQPPVCGPNETLYGDLMFPEHYSCVPHESIPDIDPGMNAPRMVPPTSRYLNPFGFSPPAGDPFMDSMFPKRIPQFPEVSPWDILINYLLSKLMPKIDDLVFRYPPADPFAGMIFPMWKEVFEQTDWNKVYSDMIQQRTYEIAIVGIILFLGVQSKI